MGEEEEEEEEEKEGLKLWEERSMWWWRRGWGCWGWGFGGGGREGKRHKKFETICFSGDTNRQSLSVKRLPED